MLYEGSPFPFVKKLHFHNVWLSKLMLSHHRSSPLTGSRHVVHAVVPPLPPQEAEDKYGHQSEDCKSDG